MPNFNGSLTIQFSIVEDTAAAAGAVLASLVPANTASVTVKTFNSSISAGPASAVTVSPAPK